MNTHSFYRKNWSGIQLELPVAGDGSQAGLRDSDKEETVLCLILVLVNLLLRPRLTAKAKV